MIGNEPHKRLTRTDKFIVALHNEFLLGRDPHCEARFRELLADWAAGEVRAPEPLVEECLAKSSGVDGDAGDWTAAKGAGLDYPSQAQADAVEE